MGKLILRAPHIEEKEEEETEADDSVASGHQVISPIAASASPARDDRHVPLDFALQLNPAHPYLVERGLTLADANVFGLGHCRHGVMKGRVAIPIHDENGRLIAYAGRWPGRPPSGKSCYRLTDGFKKELALFNLHRVAKGAEEIVVVEGFFGAMLLHKFGLPVVACMGSRMSDDQCALLAERGVQCLTFIFGASAAGEAAAKTLAGKLAAKFFVRRVILPPGHRPDTAICEMNADGRSAWFDGLCDKPFRSTSFAS